MAADNRGAQVKTQGIAQHRAAIDRIDEQLLALLNERASHSLAIRAYKSGVHASLYDPRREDDVVAALCEKNDGPLYDEHVRRIFLGIMGVMREIPSKETEGM